jgi:hypothetical protein
MVYGQEMLGSKSGGSRSREGRGDASWWDRERMARTESEEFIVMTPAKAKITPLEIWESKEFDVVNDRTSSVVDPNRVQQDVMFNGAVQTKTVVSARRSESVSSGKN